jgi:hypothetical protein
MKSLRLFLNRMHSLRSFHAVSAIAAMLLLSVLAAYAMPQPSTTSTLTASSNEVSLGSAVTLTVSVQASSVPVSKGLVLFCDAAQSYCTDNALLGSAQLNSSGTASIKLMQGLGTHSVKAVFAGTQAYKTSTSASASFTVSGSSPTTTTLVSSGSAGNYTLNATVAYHGLVVPGSAETIRFRDTSNANYTLNTATLSAPSSATYNFTTLSSSPVASGKLPTGMVLADFNGDGIPDMAVANFIDGTVSILLGNGSGSYTAASGSPITVGQGPQALVVADFNGDGYKDLAVVNTKDNTVQILLGEGSGNFSSAGSAIPVGKGPQAMVVADFNRDGIPDLAIANLYDSTVSILLGDGTGLFTEATSSPLAVGGNPNSIVTADFDQDGLADIATGNANDGTITVLLGDGTGAFSAMSGSPFSTASFPVAMTVGDFNRDGKPDLAIVSGQNKNVSILLGSGSGFTAATGSPYAVGTNPGAVAAADINGDGQLDLIIPNIGDNTATLLLGDGTGAFSTASQSPLANFATPFALALGDLNGDGTTDLALANLGANAVSVRPLLISQIATATFSTGLVPGGGNHLVDAVYDGNSDYAASNSSTVTLAGSQIDTQTTLGASPAVTVPYLQIVQLTAAISPVSEDNYTASGTVSFYDGSTLLGSTSVSNGQALFTLSALPVGTHNLSATYSGDSNFGVSSSSSLAVTVGRASTSATLTASSLTTTLGSSLTFTAKIASSNSETPTGTVRFMDGSTQLGTGTLSAGTATFGTTSLTAGSHSITAIYDGDGNYLGSTSSALSEIVFDLSVVSTGGTGSSSGGSSSSGSSDSGPSATVLPGGSATYTFSLSSNAGTSLPVATTLSVAGLPPGATATIGSSLWTAVTSTSWQLPAGNALGSVALTFNVPGTTAQTNEAPMRKLPSALWGLVLLPFAGKLRRAGKRLSRTICLLLLLAASTMAVTGLSGCASGNGYFSQAEKSYTVTITVTAGTLSQSRNVTLIVK